MSRHEAVVLGSQQKIRAAHLERLAFVYVRQSSPKQVCHNRESQLIQYQLLKRAQALGWPEERIRIIDTDQGLSGQGSAYRSGFQELVAEVSLAHAGIIFGYEVSRLARNNSDWYHLLDLAAVFDTLIADNDGIYHPRLYNDRLLLGLKGTMSEAELHLLRQRLEAGRMNQVYRAEYRQILPTGLSRRPDGKVVKDPDDQVRHAIELVFFTFNRLGSAAKVMRYMHRENLLLPRRQQAGLHAGELLWKLPTSAAILDILHNPAYAGAFVYGRKQLDPAKRVPGKFATGRLSRPLSEWLHVQKDAYPAYISWEEFLENQQRLDQNAMRFDQKLERAQGACREGSALLQGLIVCGYCGCKMAVSYKRTPTYSCEAMAQRIDAKRCMRLPGPAVEEVVVGRFFEAIEPAQFDALEAVLAEQKTEQARLVQQWEERLKRARYESHLAQRQYDCIDPENRLVAAELERRWEEKLRNLRETEEAYERFQRKTPGCGLTDELRSKLRYISKALPELWPELNNARKKELLRSLISRVICKRDIHDRVEIKIVWISGHYTLASARVPVIRQQDVTGYADMVSRVQILCREGLDDAQIASKLTQDGFYSARGTCVSPVTVQKIRLQHGWYLAFHEYRNALELEGCLTPRGLASCLGVGRTWVYRHIYDGTIPSKYVDRHPHCGVYLIRNDPDLIEQLRALLAKKCRT